MQGKIIAFFVIIFLIAGGLFYVYYKYEKTADSIDGSFVNLSVSAILDDDFIKTGYYITRDGYFFEEGETLEEGNLLVKVPINSTYVISTTNLEDQRYYNSVKQIRVLEKKPYRAELRIVPPGTLSIKHVLEKTTQTVKLNITSNGDYNDLSYCVDWSANLLWVRSNNDSESIQSYFPKYVRCYDTDEYLKDSSYGVILNYKEWKSVTDEDFIKIYFFDKIIEEGEVKYKEIGGNDYEYVISSIN